MVFDQDKELFGPSVLCVSHFINKIRGGKVGFKTDNDSIFGCVSVTKPFCHFGVNWYYLLKSYDKKCCDDSRRLQLLRGSGSHFLGREFIIWNTILQNHFNLLQSRTLMTFHCTVWPSCIFFIWFLFELSFAKTFNCLFPLCLLCFLYLFWFQGYPGLPGSPGNIGLQGAPVSFSHFLVALQTFKSWNALQVNKPCCVNNILPFV